MNMGGSVVTAEQQLEIVAQIVSMTGDPNKTARDIKETIESLWFSAKQAKDVNGEAAVVAVWNAIGGQVQLAAEQGQRGIDLAVAAREMALELTEQRDAAAKALQRKKKAIRTLDLNDPDVAKAQEAVIDGIYEDGYSIVGDPASIIYNEVGIRCDYGAGGTFFTLLTDSDIYEDIGDATVAEALKAELAAFINHFVAKYEEAVGG
jgi:hypothetical protein